MYMDCKVKIPIIKGKIYRNKLKGITYINYEYDRVYKPEKNIAFQSALRLGSCTKVHRIFCHNNFKKDDCERSA
jgi:hypothetical protein